MTKTTSVVYDHQVFGFQRYGGVSRYFYELAKRVAKAPGFSASIVAPLHVNRYLAERKIQVKGIRVPALPKTSRLISLTNHAISSAVFRISRPKLLHETYYRTASLAPRGCPVVITVYDMIHEKFKHHFSADDRTSAAKRAAVMRADRVICISEQTRMDLIDLFKIRPERLTTIHLGFSLTKTTESPATLGFAKPFFLYVGERRGYKNFSALIAAYSSSRQLREGYDLVAFGTEAFSSEENAFIAKTGLNHQNVRHISGDDTVLGQLYSNALAFVYPSLYEGFGIPPLEAMSFGCPVLCSNTSSIPEVVGDAGLYFDPYDINDIRHAMESAAASSELRTQLVAVGKRRIEAFSYDRCAAATVNVYQDVLQR